MHRVSSVDIQELRDNECELLVSAAYPYKIPINPRHDRGINIHPTLLPEGRGPWPLPYIILNNFTKSGVTIHKLEEKFDAGAILVQKAFPISSLETLESLSFKCHMTAIELIKELMPNIEQHWANSSPQQEGSYWQFPTEEKQTIDWNKPVSEIDRLIRAYGKLHSTAILGNDSWLVADATTWTEEHRFTPGTIVIRSNRELLIAALDGYVALRHFEREIKS